MKDQWSYSDSVVAYLYYHMDEVTNPMECSWLNTWLSWFYLPPCPLGDTW